MDDLDAMLDSAAAETIPTVLDVDSMLKEKNIMNDVKPWLAFSSNVTPALRDEWSRVVKNDALTELPVKFKPSNAYYSWEQHGPLFNGDKILVEMVRNAAIKSKLDDKNCAKLVAMVNPMVDQEGATEIQKEYKKQLMKDNAIVVRQDTNYSAEKFPKLAASIEGLY